MLRQDSSEPLLQGILRSELLRPENSVLVAVSGGPDSTALLVALHELGFDVIAAHFDHALRAGSEQVADQVGALCARLGVRLVASRRDSPMPRGSVQAGARALRYEFLEQTRAQVAADSVALAHTADDVVEGAVLHLMRGCGLSGLRGMPASRGSYVRPLLAVWRTEVVEFLQRRGIAAYQDPANSDMHFARARLRHQILPALERDRPGIGRRFHAVARRAAAMQQGIEQQASRRLGEGVITRWDLARMPEPIAAELIKGMFTNAGGRLPALSRSHVRSMLRLASGVSGGRGIDLPGGRRFRIVGDLMEIYAPAPSSSAPQLKLKPCDGCDDSNAAHLRADLHVRLGFRRPGLRMRPAGGRGSRKLQDILVDARVPREDRDSWPLVFAGDRLAWVPGIAVDSDLRSMKGEPALHVAISPMPDRWQSKVVRLETPIYPRGESS
jgi:tRNA(Ile)-lysidine synthetase-like protein